MHIIFQDYIWVALSETHGIYKTQQQTWQNCWHELCKPIGKEDSLPNFPFSCSRKQEADMYCQLSIIARQFLLHVTFWIMLFLQLQQIFTTVRVLGIWTQLTLLWFNLCNRIAEQVFTTRKQPTQQCFPLYVCLCATLNVCIEEKHYLWWWYKAAHSQSMSH